MDQRVTFGSGSGVTTDSQYLARRDAYNLAYGIAIGIAYSNATVNATFYPDCNVISDTITQRRSTVQVCRPIARAMWPFYYY